MAISESVNQATVSGGDSPSTKADSRKAGENSDEHEPIVSNEYVLNVAFLSFLVFTAVQFVFAFMARSQSMMADCAAMSVDVVSYFVNFMAERLKHGHTSMTPNQLRLKRLYLELIPPGISVLTLIVVTAMALQVAIETLIDAYRGKGSSTPPDLNLMLLFSAFNLLLDFLNVTCFARADQAVGLPGQHGSEDIHVHFDQSEQHKPVTEGTPLVSKQQSSAGENQGDESSDVETKGMNLNMCSAWTHVCADTLRSVAVLIAAGFSFLFPELLSPIEADSWGAVVVSFIILASLVPLLHGLYMTAVKIRAIWSANRESTPEDHLKRMVIEV
eukprot:CAMPEP_0172441864 /NCGR_PEP_ID=MMETSP1065-20121228/2376_1 /TAXON_ID=265537 /ORGANISM="Amphiprora paludosa, Strain CCMP125" /LENGTH=329 /DNA_ID=CAMNT_0013191459 /DNA_START=55 /DNA_END=1044 /DNA_ORIENTATION=+